MYVGCFGAFVLRFLLIVLYYNHIKRQKTFSTFLRSVIGEVMARVI